MGHRFRSVKSLQTNGKGINPNHREHRSKKGRQKHNRPWRKLLRNRYKRELEELKINDLENYENYPYIQLERREEDQRVSR